MLFPGELLCFASAWCSSKTMHPTRGAGVQAGPGLLLLHRCFSSEEVIDSYHNTSHWDRFRASKHLSKMIERKSKLSRKLSIRKRMSSQKFALAFLKNYAHQDNKLHIFKQNLFLQEDCFPSKRPLLNTLTFLMVAITRETRVRALLW